MFYDTLFILGGRTKDGGTCFNDIWVYVQDTASESKYRQFHTLSMTFVVYLMLLTN